MTLDTRIYILDEVPVQDLFVECQRQLGLLDEDRRGPDRQEWRDEPRSYGLPGSRTVENACGQGLPAWLMVHYRPNAQYRTAADAAEHEYCNLAEADDFDPAIPICDRVEHDPVCWAEISIDTAYSYRGLLGMRCGDLHVAFMLGLAPWLAERGISWKWLNEYSSEVYAGTSGLETLLSGTDDAMAWFDNTVMPAILSGAILPGGAS